eukprot:tig00021043_g17626.t1
MAAPAAPSSKPKGPSGAMMPIGLTGHIGAGKKTLMDPLRRAVGEILKARPELVECGGEKVSFTTGKFELGHSYRIDPEVWSKYLIDLFCCIFVVDAADAENLDKCRRTLHKARPAPAPAP